MQREPEAQADEAQEDEAKLAPRRRRRDTFVGWVREKRDHAILAAILLGLIGLMTEDRFRGRDGDRLEQRIIQIELLQRQMPGMWLNQKVDELKRDHRHELEKQDDVITDLRMEVSRLKGKLEGRREHPGT